MKFGKDSDQWPKDSLRRSLLLNYPGCKSSLDALALTKSQLNESASQEYKSMRQAIIDIELSLNGIDIDLLDSSVRDNLREMPLKTLGDIELWKQGWMTAIKKHGTD